MRRQAPVVNKRPARNTCRDRTKTWWNAPRDPAVPAFVLDGESDDEEIDPDFDPHGSGRRAPKRRRGTATAPAAAEHVNVGKGRPVGCGPNIPEAVGLVFDSSCERILGKTELGKYRIYLNQSLLDGAFESLGGQVPANGEITLLDGANLKAWVVKASQNCNGYLFLTGLQKIWEHFSAEEGQWVVFEPTEAPNTFFINVRD